MKQIMFFFNKSKIDYISTPFEVISDKKIRLQNRSSYFWRITKQR